LAIAALLPVGVSIGLVAGPTKIVTRANVLPSRPPESARLRCALAHNRHTFNGRATFSGIGFFDRPHGQTGAAPNGIELHPVLGEDVDMSYPFLLIGRMASADYGGAFLSAARTTCGKGAGRMDGECTLILVALTAGRSVLLGPSAVWDRQSPAGLASQAVVRSPCSINGGRKSAPNQELASIERPGHGGAERWPPCKSLQEEDARCVRSSGTL